MNHEVESYEGELEALRKQVADLKRQNQIYVKRITDLEIELNNVHHTAAFYDDDYELAQQNYDRFY